MNPTIASLEPKDIWRNFAKLNAVPRVNLVLDKPVMEEFLADRCDPDFLTPAVHKLLVDKDLNAEKRRQLAALPEELGAHDAPPDARAAGIIHELMSQT